MRIALVSGEFPPMEGGVGAFTQEIARAFDALGHEVHVITSNKAMPAGAGKEHRGRHAQPYDLGFAALHPHIGRWRWPSVAKIADLTLRHEFDVVNIQYQAAAYNMNSPAVSLLPWRLKYLAKTAVTFHDLRTAYLFPKAGRLRDKAISFLANQSAGVITTNTADFNNLRTRTDTPLTTIPIGSNIESYRPNHVEISEALADLELPEEAKLIGYFGFVNHSKGTDTLIYALARLPSTYHLVFIGGQTGASDETNEAFVSQIVEQIDELGLTNRVHWTGFVSDVRVSTFLHAADLIALPYRDGVSLRRGTLMAALAHGRPLVTTSPEKALPEVMNGENAWLVPPDDETQLASAILRLMENSSLRQRLGEGAAALAAQFSWDKIARRTILFFDSLEDPRREGV